jgi:hypothetical protein
MEAFLIMLVVFGLLISVGIVISVLFYARGALGVGRFRRIRLVRFLKPRHSRAGNEETIEEIVEEEVPVEADA